MYNYINGNATISLDEDGTRVIQCEGDLKLDYPLNLDVKVSGKCSLGTECMAVNGYCDECNEDAEFNGPEANYIELKDLLYGLPKWMEISIRSNNITDELVKFFRWCKNQDFLMSLNINQNHVSLFTKQISQMLTDGSLKSVHIAVRDVMAFKELPKHFRTNRKLIAKLSLGMDEPTDINYLTKECGVRNVLVQGFKKVGRGVVFLPEEVELNIAHWKWYIGPHLKRPNLSFDNDALDQIEIKKFFHNDAWKNFYQESECLYIDAVRQMISEYAGSPIALPWSETSIRLFYQLTKTSLKN